MITRTVKLQLVAFLVITALALVYTGLNYVGLGQRLVGAPAKVTVQLADSGGLFTSAQVSYRGVPVGRVSQMKLTDAGVDAVVEIKHGAKIPSRGIKAVVGNLSA